MAEDELSISDYVQNLSPVRVGPKNNFLTFIYKWKARNLLGQSVFVQAKESYSKSVQRIRLLSR